MAEQKPSSDSQRRNLTDAVQKTKGNVKDMIAAAFELAEEDPRGTMELIEPPLTIDIKGRPPAALEKMKKQQAASSPAPKAKKSAK
ncbi:MAG: hypothetical protein L6Q71_03900 [Planctomycetes bacterium]|nr:hypothetical protein [Planctomycetota bacterium]NUQ34355.1 hypothetical protein [Planctomycetaceae bacterium]